MKEILLGTIFLVILSSLNAQQNNLIVIGSIDSIHSKILGEQRKIWIHLPESYPNNIHAKRQYPVIYLLDAEWNFRDIVGMIPSVEFSEWQQFLSGSDHRWDNQHQPHERSHAYQSDRRVMGR